MSEQVGASLVLAQVLLPNQSGASTQAAASVVGDSPPSEMHPVDPIEEIAPFSALLTELKNLQARIPAAIDRPLDALITVQVETELPEIQTRISGTDLPETGKLLPAAGGVLSEPPGLPLLPIEPILPMENTEQPLAETDLPDDVTIVIRESARPENPATIPAPIQRAEARSAGANPLTPDVSSMQPPAPASTAQPPPVPAPVPTHTDPSSRVADGQPALPSGQLTSSANSAAAAGDPSSGQHQGERGADRQAQPTLNPRAPSISFSLDGLPGAAAATPQGATATPAQLSQPLILLGQPTQWTEQLAERLAGLATRGANTAEIRLHPPSLGHLEVRITLANDQATVHVASANPEVRDALQQALPRLDNLLNGLGIELAESEISEGQAEGFHRDAEGRAGGEPGGNGDSGEPVERRPRNRLSILDTWA